MTAAYEAGLKAVREDDRGEAITSTNAGCPFCDARPQCGLNKTQFCQLHGDSYQTYTIKCPNGCAHITRPSKQLAEEYWNKRLSTAQIAALQAECARYKAVAIAAVENYYGGEGDEQSVARMATEALAAKPVEVSDG